MIIELYYDFEANIIAKCAKMLIIFSAFSMVFLFFVLFRQFFLVASMLGVVDVLRNAYIFVINVL